MQKTGVSWPHLLTTYLSSMKMKTYGKCEAFNVPPAALLLVTPPPIVTSDTLTTNHSVPSVFILLPAFLCTTQTHPTQPH